MAGDDARADTDKKRTGFGPHSGTEEPLSFFYYQNLGECLTAIVYTVSSRVSLLPIQNSGQVLVRTYTASKTAIPTRNRTAIIACKTLLCLDPE
jgi:hypothetical protein